MHSIRHEIMPGVYLNYVHAVKFKTGSLSVQLITPLDETTAAQGALLPAVLRRGTMRCPDMRALSTALDLLYGASVAYTVRKKGENQCLGFVASFIDEAYIPAGEKLLEPMCDLLGELLLDPVTKGGRFVSEYVESEKVNLIDAIRGVINDKRDYADMRLLQEMCADEPYGVSRWGDEETVKKINNQKLYQHYQSLLPQSRMELFYCGSAELSRVESALCEAFAALGRGKAVEIEPAIRCAAPAQPHIVTESMDVTQGKLSMGFRCGSNDVPALIMANLMFGGSSNSKLFLNVREKLSLCYYASSSYTRSKGIISVSSGIETRDYDRAYTEIVHQLNAIQNGEWEDWELEGARSTMLSSLQSLRDSQGALENFYLGQAATGQTDTPEELAEEIKNVTPERICAAAQTVGLDTVYFLKGKEGE